ncbi:MAG: hypothetical protein ACO1OB_22065 [Archangium sp.]
MSRVVIAGAGSLAQKLQTHLGSRHEVRLTTGVDLTARHEAEVAFAGAEVVVMLAQARAPLSPLKTAALGDIDRLMADSVARAAKLVGARQLIHFACGDEDARLPLLEKSGVKVSVLRGGGPDPVTALANLIDGGAVPAPAQWSSSTPTRDEPRWRTCSVQRCILPRDWTATKIAEQYFEWIPGNAPFTKVTRVNGVFTLHVLGIRALVLRREPGRSDDDSAWFEIADGAFAERGKGRLEFRRLLDGTALVGIIGYQPSLPFFIYRFTQSLLHERVMKRFGTWLEAQG